MTDTIWVPTADLKITKTNARKDHTVDRALVASIVSVGLLYPLVVDAIDDGYDVVDGAQRLMAVREAVKTGLLDAREYAQMPCIVRGNGAATNEGLEISLHANLRTPMHPLDECEAIFTLAKKGEDRTSIALRFGKDVRWLEQRVKLAQLVPEVKKAFRDGTIGLHHAMAFTLGTPEQQKAFVKRHKDLAVHAGQIDHAMTEKKVPASAANFDLALYPEELIQRDLFAPANDPLSGTWLLDPKKFAELQDAWAAETIQAYKQLGYNRVEVLERNDWSTLTKYVKFQGKVKTAEQRSKLAVFLKSEHSGHIEIHENMASVKAVEKAKVKKAAEANGVDTTDEEPKPMKATEWSANQNEILNALAAIAIFNEVSSGKADETMVQYLVVSKVFHKQAFWTDYDSIAFAHAGTRKRWQRLAQQYPDEALLAEDEDFDKKLAKALSYADFKALPKKERSQLYFAAVAAMIYPPNPQQHLKSNMEELQGLDWLAPGKDFFKRWRTDQLIDYRKRSGDKEAGKTTKAKEAHVADCLVLSGEAASFKLGLIK